MTIEEYLDELLARSTGPAGEVRRLLVETEAHLRDAADAEVAAGLDPDAAQLRAIERFGSPRAVARAAHRARRPFVVAALAVAFVRMAAAGLVAVGLSALLARLLAMHAGTAFVYGLPAGAAVPAGNCARWLVAQPAATSCARAASLENADDTLMLRVGGAIVGLLVLAVAWALLRRRPRAATPDYVPAMGLTLFGVAGVVLLLGAYWNFYVPGLWGRGMWFVEGTIALAVAAGYGLAFAHRLRPA
jgi:hypothetical protein